MKTAIANAYFFPGEVVVEYKSLLLDAGKEFREIVQLGKGGIKVMTSAPEMFTDDQIFFLGEKDILLSAVHSNMNYEQPRYYSSRCIHLTTQLYNAILSFMHRVSGMTGAILDNENVYVSLILDSHHCDYAAAHIAYRLKNGRLFLVTDSTFPGRRFRNFEWDTFEVMMQICMYRNQPGHLPAGADISIPEAVKNAKENLGISLRIAVEMATSSHLAHAI